MLKWSLCYKYYDNLFYIHASDLEVIGNLNKGSRLHDAKIGSISKNLYLDDPMFPIIMRLEEDKNGISHFYSVCSTEEFFMKEKVDFKKYVTIDNMPFSKPFYKFNSVEVARIKEDPLCFSIKGLNPASGGERAILKKSEYAEKYLDVMDVILDKAYRRQDRSFERSKKNTKGKVLTKTRKTSIL